MKITRLEMFHVRPRWLFLKMHTDVGIVGLGEPIMEARALTVETAVREMERWLIGQDPRRIEHIWQTLYRSAFYRNGPVLTSALSGVEQALWDILGKSLGVPVYQLLGGRVRDKIRMYGWIRGVIAEEYINAIKGSMREHGFTAYKMGPIPAMRMIETPAAMARIVEFVAAVRQAAGDEIDIGIDFHGRTSPALARRLCRMIEPYHPMFVEEPVLPGDTLALKELSRATTIPIATGERLFTRWGFQDIIEQEAVAIIQPDLSHAGGILEVRKIAAMAESRNIAVAPHCPLGPIALAASLQLAACTPNFLCQEHVTLGETYLKEPFKVVNGYIDVPTKPGLGIELDDEKVQAGLFDGKWDNPKWWLEDGSFAEW
jgi:galactonate dehydratase